MWPCRPPASACSLGAFCPAPSQALTRLRTSSLPPCLSVFQELLPGHSLPTRHHTHDLGAPGSSSGGQGRNTHFLLTIPARPATVGHICFRLLRSTPQVPMCGEHSMCWGEAWALGSHGTSDPKASGGDACQWGDQAGSPFLPPGDPWDLRSRGSRCDKCREPEAPVSEAEGPGSSFSASACFPVHALCCPARAQGPRLAKAPLHPPCQPSRWHLSPPLLELGGGGAGGRTGVPPQPVCPQSTSRAGCRGHHCPQKGRPRPQSQRQRWLEPHQHQATRPCLGTTRRGNLARGQAGRLRLAPTSSAQKGQLRP